MTTRTFGKFAYRKMLRYFVQGVLVLAPITITGWLLYSMFSTIDGLLRPTINIPGLGFLIIIAFVIFIGYFSTNFLMGSLLTFFNTWIERTPGVKFIYSTVKDFFGAFAGDKKKFDKPILVSITADDVWMIGFLTNEDLQRFELGEEYVSAYVPQGYNIAGQLYLVKRTRIRKLNKMTASEAMKFAVTGGVVQLNELSKNK